MAYQRNDEWRHLLVFALRVPMTTAECAKRVRGDESAVRRVLRLMLAEGSVCTASARTHNHRSGLAVWGLSSDAVGAEVKRLEALDPPRLRMRVQ